MPPVNGVVDFVRSPTRRRRKPTASAPSSPASASPCPTARSCWSPRTPRAHRHAARHRARLRLGGRADAAARHRRRRGAGQFLPAPHRRHHRTNRAIMEGDPRRAFPCAARTTRSTSSSPASTPCWAASSSSWTAAPGVERHRPRPAHAARPAAPAPGRRASAPRRRRTTTPRPRRPSPKPTSSWKFSALLRIAQVEAGAQKSASPSSIFGAGPQHRRGLPAAEDSGHALDIKIEDGVRSPAIASSWADDLEPGRERAAPHARRLDGALALRRGGTASRSRCGQRPIFPKPSAAVFDRFYRLDRSRSTAGRASAFVKAIAGLHGLTIELVDRKPGLGVVVDQLVKLAGADLVRSCWTAPIRGVRPERIVALQPAGATGCQYPASLIAHRPQEVRRFLIEFQQGAATCLSRSSARRDRQRSDSRPCLQLGQHFRARDCRTSGSIWSRRIRSASTPGPRTSGGAACLATAIAPAPAGSGATASCS